jgi:hypothetical protein
MVETHGECKPGQWKIFSGLTSSGKRGLRVTREEAPWLELRPVAYRADKEVDCGK